MTCRSDTGLSSVDPLAKQDATHRNSHVGVVKDDGGTFATQFERDRRQMLSSRFRDNFADVAGTSIENVVEAKLE